MPPPSLPTTGHRASHSTRASGSWDSDELSDATQPSESGAVAATLAGRIGTLLPTALPNASASYTPKSRHCCISPNRISGQEGSR